MRLRTSELQYWNTGNLDPGTDAQTNGGARTTKFRGIEVAAVACSKLSMQTATKPSEVILLQQVSVIVNLADVQRSVLAFALQFCSHCTCSHM